MHKILLLFLGLVLMNSCSQNAMDEDIVLVSSGSELAATTSENVELLSVKAQLDSLNYVMFSDQVQSRKFSDIFKKIVAVVTADAVSGMLGFALGPVGAAVGAVVGSGSVAFVPAEDIHFSDSSYNFDYFEATGFMPMNDPRVAITSNLLPSLNTTNLNGNKAKFIREDSIGYIHNKALLDLKDAMVGRRYTLDNIIDATADITSEIYSEPKDSILTMLNSNKSFYKEILKKSILTWPKYSTPNEIFDDWKAQYPEQSNKLSVLESYLQGVTNSKTNLLPEHLNKSLKIIDNSALDQNTKQDLRNGFIVGNSSYQLWNVPE